MEERSGHSSPDSVHALLFLVGLRRREKEERCSPGRRWVPTSSRCHTAATAALCLGGDSWNSAGQKWEKGQSYRWRHVDDEQSVIPIPRNPCSKIFVCFSRHLKHFVQQLKVNVYSQIDSDSYFYFYIEVYFFFLFTDAFLEPSHASTHAHQMFCRGQEDVDVFVCLRWPPNNISTPFTTWYHQFWVPCSVCWKYNSDEHCYHVWTFWGALTCNAWLFPTYFNNYFEVNNVFFYVHNSSKLEISWNNQAFHTLPALRLHSMLHFLLSTAAYVCIQFKKKEWSQGRLNWDFLPVAWSKSHSKPQTGLFSSKKKKRKNKHIFPMEGIVKMLYMEISVFQCGEGYDTEAEEKCLLSQRWPNSTMNSVIATKMQPLSPPVNKMCFDFRSVRRQMKTNLPHVLADTTSEKTSQPSKLFSLSISPFFSMQTP